MSSGAGYPGVSMYRFGVGLVISLAIAPLGASVTAAQEAPALTTPDSADAPSDADIANMALVCVATYDLVMAQQPAGPQAEAISDARDLARSIYIEATQSDEATADADISRIDKALAEAVASGEGNLDEYHSTCDSLLMEEYPDGGGDTGATIS